MQTNEADVAIEAIGSGDDRVAEIERMFVAMYEHMQSLGLAVPLARGGEKQWLRAIQPTLGRSSILYVAAHGADIVGFAHGALRLQPSHLEPTKTGFVTHVYVDPKVRGKSVGKRLVGALEAWFVAHGANAIELHVVRGNEQAKKFWEGHGYQLDLVQLRKTLPAQHTTDGG